ncbi:cation:proton antiporter [Rubinisphaera brasiliensis]|uniref:Sodium/hydrogen exchanger n=1 Tax=Rubinisphaera brasiliensis (strain ATCC 49424 / DSM 5305 / JCM 21570 / IAM 15109 / NBRC 103401 / IFAM 1448) TaxID=756272 RepID=F0SHJ7_RUBBR|nr:sodium:proton antiporter [Rubinisphaera brasiliensis]ADY58435.1 sodium/hydrogen exchanger [Rubinisphaera brasiliensis DSM 5305]
MDSPLFYLTGLFVLGIAAQWLAWRLRLPAILLLLAFGFAANLWVDPTQIIDDELLFPIVSLSVAIILFDGGLSLKLGELRHTSGSVIRLVTIGCGITWVLGAISARLIFSSWELAALAGAIYTVTGPTVIGPLLRHVRPNATVSSVAKWEGIVIDPIGALLAVLVSVAVASGNVTQAAMDVVLSLSATIGIAAILGFATAYALIVLFRRHLIPDYLQNSVLLATVLATYTLSNTLQAESGLATVTVLGIIMANQRTVSISHLVEFKENLGVLLISVLFILLASRYRFSELLYLGWPAVAFLLILIFIIRPIAVMVSTYGTSLKWKERVFLSFLAPRGIVAAAVSSVFALEFSHLMGDHPDDSAMVLLEVEKLVPLTFLVIVGTVAFYGLTAAPLARRLGISEVNPQGVLFAGADRLVRAIAGTLNKAGFRVLLVDTNHGNIAAARMLGLPTVNASILSEFAREKLDLGGLGRFIAMTPNDQVNSLAALEFQDVFERAELYQVKPNISEKQREALSRESKRARYVFSGGTTYWTLLDKFDEGFLVKSSKLTEEYPYSAFREKYGADAILLFVVDEAKKLTVCTDEKEATPHPGDTVIALVPNLAGGKTDSTPPPASEDSHV